MFAHAMDIDQDLISPDTITIRNRRPVRYAEIGQSEQIAPPPAPVMVYTMRKGKLVRVKPKKERIRQDVYTVAFGLMDDVLDPRTEEGYVDESPRELDPLEPPVTRDAAAYRVRMLDAHMAQPLALVLAAADGLGVGRTDDPTVAPAFDLGRWVDARLGTWSGDHRIIRRAA